MARLAIGSPWWWYEGLPLQPQHHRRRSKRRAVSLASIKQATVAVAASDYHLYVYRPLLRLPSIFHPVLFVVFSPCLPRPPSPPNRSFRRIRKKRQNNSIGRGGVRLIRPGRDYFSLSTLTIVACARRWAERASSLGNTQTKGRLKVETTHTSRFACETEPAAMTAVCVLRK